MLIIIMTIILVISSTARLVRQHRKLPKFRGCPRAGRAKTTSGMFLPIGNVYPRAKACASAIALLYCWRVFDADPRTFSSGGHFFAKPLTGRPEVRKFLRDSVAVRCATPLLLAPLRIRAVCGWSQAKGVLLWLAQCLRNVVLRRRPLGALRPPVPNTRLILQPLR